LDAKVTLGRQPISGFEFAGDHAPAEILNDLSGAVGGLLFGHYTLNGLTTVRSVALDTAIVKAGFVAAATKRTVVIGKTITKAVWDALLRLVAGV
jgi:hypothetical protein